MCKYVRTIYKYTFYLRVRDFDEEIGESISEVTDTDTLFLKRENDIKHNDYGIKLDGKIELMFCK